MCNKGQSSSARAAFGHDADETWEADSASSCSEDTDSEPEPTAPRLVMAAAEDGDFALVASSSGRPPRSVERRPREEDVATASAARIMRAASSVAGSPIRAAVPPALTAATPPAAVAEQRKRSGAQDGLVELVAHLRRDNMRLRQALTAAQEEVAKVSDASKASHSVDFKHLLSLVRDFGGEEWCAGDDSTADPHSPLPVSDAGGSTRCSTSPDPHKSGRGIEMFSLEDEDDEEDAVACEDVKGVCEPHVLHATHLLNTPAESDSSWDRELAESREEVLHLRAKLEASQREVSRLRSQVQVSKQRV